MARITKNTERSQTFFQNRAVTIIAIRIKIIAIIIFLKFINKFYQSSSPSRTPHKNLARLLDRFSNHLSSMGVTRYTQIMTKRISTTKAVIFSFFLLSIVSVIIGGRWTNNSISTLFTVSTFLFGIYTGFSISSRHSRLNSLRDILRQDTAVFIFIYKSAIIYGEKTQKEIQKLIDNYFIDQIDFYLDDFKYSSKSFYKLFDYIINLKTSNNNQEIVHDKSIDLLSDSLNNRKAIETLVKSRMLKFEWFFTLLLLGIIIFSIIFFNPGGIIMTLTSILLATAAVIIALILRDLDNLQWKESGWIWEQLDTAFLEMDLQPYYPEGVIKTGRFKLDRSHPVRVASYPTIS